MSTWSYGNQVRKHFAIFLNFPCLYLISRSLNFAIFSRQYFAKLSDFRDFDGGNDKISFNFAKRHFILFFKKKSDLQPF